MGKRVRTIEWKTNELTLNFDSQLSPLVKALTTIHEYRPHSSEPSEPSEILLDVIDIEWHTLQLWFLNEKFELFDVDDGPIPKEMMQMFEPKARVVNAELNLWKALFRFNAIKPALDYDTALEAWTMTQLESKEEDFSDACQGLEYRAIADNLRKKR